MLSVEYPGYGMNFDKGVTTSSAINTQTLTVVRYLQTELKVTPSDLILLGISLGSGVATSLAVAMRADPPRALVLVSPYYSMGGVVGSMLRCSWIAKCFSKR